MPSFPISLVTRAAAHMPLPFVRIATGRAFATVLRSHPRLFDRLGDQARKRYAFVPTDLPFAFLVEPARRRFAVVCKRGPIRAHATATGSILLLLGLLEGRSDGDAAFFSRGLVVSGDMEAMLALRNALDDSGIDLPTDLGASAGLFAPLLTRAGRVLRDRLLGREGEQWS